MGSQLGRVLGGPKMSLLWVEGTPPKTCPHPSPGTWDLIWRAHQMSVALNPTTRVLLRGERQTQEAGGRTQTRGRVEADTGVRHP